MTPIIAHGAEGTALKGHTFKIFAFTRDGSAVYAPFEGGDFDVAPVQWFTTALNIPAPPPPAKK